MSCANQGIRQHSSTILAVCTGPRPATVTTQGLTLPERILPHPQALAIDFPSRTHPNACPGLLSLGSAAVAAP